MSISLIHTLIYNPTQGGRSSLGPGKGLYTSYRLVRAFCVTLETSGLRSEALGPSGHTVSKLFCGAASTQDTFGGGGERESCRVFGPFVCTHAAVAFQARLVYIFFPSRPAESSAVFASSQLVVGYLRLPHFLR
eukprot:3523519-Pleurochrysis_carterae.AAC.1